MFPLSTLTSMINYLINVFLLIVGVQGELLALVKATKARRKLYLRPGTRNNIVNYMRTFLYFCFHYNLEDNPVTPALLCMFIEFF